MRELIFTWPVFDQVIAIAAIMSILTLPWVIVAVSKQLDRIIRLLEQQGPDR